MQKGFKAILLIRRKHIYVKLLNTQCPLEGCGNEQAKLPNRILVIIKPIWTYGVQLWCCAKPSNTKILQRIQSKVLRISFNAPWYISNKTLHNYSEMPPVEEEIKRLTINYIQNLTDHPNVLTSHLLAPPSGPKTAAPKMANRRT